jgi:ABC-type Na+ transport system ATPase subunit NatA
LSAVIHLRRFLKCLCDKKHGILISSHAMNEVEKLADYLVIINQGIVLLQGTMHDICIQTQTNNLEAAFVKLVYQITDIE